MRPAVICHSILHEDDSLEATIVIIVVIFFFFMRDREEEELVNQIGGCAENRAFDQVVVDRLLKMLPAAKHESVTRVVIHTLFYIS